MRRIAAVLSCLLVLLLLAGCVLPGAEHREDKAPDYIVVLHPDGQLYVGDQVSFEVIAPPGQDTSGHSLSIRFEGRELGRAGFQPWGLGQRNEASFWWIWDTHGLQPGSYTLTFSSLPDGDSWTETVSLASAARLPAAEAGAHWSETVTTCCDIFTISGTAAARDLGTLGPLADQQSAAVLAQLGASRQEKLTLVFIPRVLGNGGFTQDGVYISYLDGNYVATNMAILLHHEFVHFYDDEIGGDFRPPIFEEGLAVYLAGGHYKPEPLVARAGELLPLGLYIPLEELADDFYNQQHEIGYLESAALVGYLVQTYGWTAFDQFYRSIPMAEGEAISQAIDRNLQARFQLSLADLDVAFKKYLAAQPPDPVQAQDLTLTMRYFDTARRYQQEFDPSAYFLTAWLPNGTVMRQRGIVADLLRHPQGWQNRSLEGLLGLAWEQISAGQYAAARRTLGMVDLGLKLLAPFFPTGLPQD